MKRNKLIVFIIIIFLYITIFTQHVRGDFDSYMLDMAKPKTYGTMLELRALCCMYR